MQKQQGLTRFPQGSVGELWTVSYPLMISTLATLLMLFTDRIFLAHYSLPALNASVNAGTLAWAFMGGFAMVTAMSEVFVAQYNGSKQHLRLGIPVWQMLWACAFSLIFFIPLAIWGAPAFFGGDRYADLEIKYFRLLMIFAPSYAILTAFAGFFIGQGKTQMMIWLAIIANVFNILLDWLLIFGVDGWISELGIEGAAIATCFGYCFESIVLAFLFLKKDNRLNFGTAQWHIDWAEMKKCLKIGFPQGIFVTLEIIGWAVFYWMMTALSEMHITISSLCQSILIFFSFFCDGLNRGSAAVAGNFLGAKQPQMVYKVLRSGVMLLIPFSLSTSLIMIFYPEIALQIFFFENGTLSQIVSIDSLKMCLILSFFYLFFDGIRWVLGGLLTAAGDTLFLLVFGSLSVWLFLLAPLYWIVVKNNLAVEYAWGLAAIYSFVFCAAYYVRFRQGAWQKIDLVTPSHTEAQWPTLSDESTPKDPTA